MRGTCLIFFLSLTLAGCSDSDADKLRKVGDKTYDRAAVIVQQTWDELGRTLLDQQQSSPQHDLLTRVQLRLKWDRDLAELPIVASAAGDVITLTGTVKAGEQKDRAISLANSTIGVSKVDDQLVVAEKPKAVEPDQE